MSEYHQLNSNIAQKFLLRQFYFPDVIYFKCNIGSTPFDKKSFGRLTFSQNTQQKMKVSTKRYGHSDVDQTVRLTKCLSAKCLSIKRRGTAS